MKSPKTTSLLLDRKLNLLAVESQSNGNRKERNITHKWLSPFPTITPSLEPLTLCFAQLFSARVKSLGSCCLRGDNVLCTLLDHVEMVFSIVNQYASRKHILQRCLRRILHIWSPNFLAPSLFWPLSSVEAFVAISPLDGILQVKSMFPGTKDVGRDDSAMPGISGPRHDGNGSWGRSEPDVGLAYMT